MDNTITPKENIDIYCMLFSIETALRELIISAFLNIGESQWLKRRLPGDILKKCRESIEFEKSIPWTNLISHHPIYFIDFPDLRKIIERDDNWREVFKDFL